ncbi:MAG: relaxase/mobilization nuclease domain-containing protein [Bacteroidota bacterium]|nr:relaxase/mobilization nuclease domain-containing protein [Bacteroidota bacterium]
MIYKVMTRSTPTYKGLIEYILNESKTPDSHIFTHNLRSKKRDVKNITKEFIENESYRKYSRSDQVFLNHEIISFSNMDSVKIQPAMIQDIMNRYISLRGENGVYLASVHQDTSQIHVHIMVSGLQYRSGRSFYIPKDKLFKLKKDLQEYQKEKYPEISYSLPNHGSKREYVTDRKWFAKHKEDRSIEKVILQKTIKEAFEISSTQKEFLNLLAKQNLHYYERSGSPAGIISGNSKFRFSRLGISKELFNDLPFDFTEESQALKEIELIRKSRNVNTNIEMER